MSSKTKIIIIAVALLTSFAFGRYSAPEHTVTQTDTSNKEKSSEKENKDVQVHKKVVQRTVTKPDGTKETTTITTDDREKKSSLSQTDSKNDHTSQKTETTTSSSKVTISALAGINLFGGSYVPDYGLNVSRPVLGPITVNLFGFKSGVCGAGIGLTF